MIPSSVYVGLVFRMGVGGQIGPGPAVYTFEGLGWRYSKSLDMFI